MVANGTNGGAGPGMPRDDIILPFQVEPFSIRGRFTRLGKAANTILAAHDYPDPVARLMAEMLVLAPSLAGALKYEGVFTLQIKGNGPVTTLMADVTSEGALRGYAGFDSKAVTTLANEHGSTVPLQRLTCGGYIAFTVDQGRHAERYQGIAELACASLAECTQAYFRNSEQLQTGIKIAATQTNDAWRASSLMIQRLPFSGDEGIAAGITEDEYDESWRTALVLMSSCTTDELVGSNQAPEALLYRLFHETGVRTYPDQMVKAQCRCTVEKVERVLRSLTTEQLNDMTVNGVVSVVCEFCKDERHYNEEALATLRATSDNEIAS
ncbi:MAG: molecular chaperone Hsp33 [Rhodospirillaceae bacterium]|nr:molecular chaperone Hsp33 [Rhodospirillaceae bacterium]